jgi:hypothetical protein
MVKIHYVHIDHNVIIKLDFNLFLIINHLGYPFSPPSFNTAQHDVLFLKYNICIWHYTVYIYYYFNNTKAYVHSLEHYW